VRTASSCRELAALAQARHVDPEQAYATGLLHDVGQIALANADAAAYGEVLDASGGDEAILLEVEREAFGLDHAAYGAWILRQWRLPESIAAAVERHHHPELWSEVEPLERLLRMHDRFDEAWMSGGAEQALATRENELMLLLDIPPDLYEQHLEERVELARAWRGLP
jgi:putative nucleotidyltransferase with HDIG domain